MLFQYLPGIAYGSAMFLVMISYELVLIPYFTALPTRAEAQTATTTISAATTTAVQAPRSNESVKETPTRKPAHQKTESQKNAVNEHSKTTSNLSPPFAINDVTAPPEVIPESATIPSLKPEEGSDPALPLEPAKPGYVASAILFEDKFTSYENGLITNEYALWNPTNSSAHVSPKWEMTAGSLFAKDGAAWTGVPDSGTAPNAESSNANNSGIFRLTTKQANFKNVKVSFDLNTHKLSSTAKTPAVDWDGVHIFLRYQSQYHLYYASINRRDNSVIIKKKMPGGPSNGGTYYNLSTSNHYSVLYDSWQKVEATIKDNPDGSVTIQLFGNGKLVASATDKGMGGAPIRNPGKVGIRADNADVQFKNFVVTSL